MEEVELRSTVRGNGGLTRGLFCSYIWYKLLNYFTTFDNRFAYLVRKC